MLTDPGMCVAWWYLTRAKLQLFIGVFLHRSRPEYMLELAEGFTTRPGWTKDEHYVRSHWEFNDPSDRAKARAYVMKYAYAICKSREKIGFKVSQHSFSKDTGKLFDPEMTSWEAMHTASYLGFSGRTDRPHPDWWPTTVNLRRIGAELSTKHAAEKLMEGFDLAEVIKLAKDKARRSKKRGSHAKVTKRIGRFTVYVKTDDTSH